jgi:TolA-binding protein
LNCSNCAATNPNEALYCLQCGEPLTASASARRRTAELREKKTKEIELTEAVATRFTKWSKMLAGAIGVPLLLLSLLLGKSIMDARSVIETGKTQISNAVNDGKGQISQSIEAANAEIAKARQQLPAINQDIQQLKTDVGRYKNVNQHIEKLQSDFLQLQNQVVDLGQRPLKAKSLELTGGGPGMFSLGETGCDAKKAAGSPVSYCAQGAPVMLTSMSADGRTRPVASFSDMGFQDLSKSPRPACTEERRGTIFIQKGSGRQNDRAIICVKTDTESYNWFQFVTTN